MLHRGESPMAALQALLVPRPMAQRRRLTRKACSIAVLCHAEGHEFEGQVLDMSLGGMRIAADRSLRPGTLLSIRYCEHAFDVSTVHTRVAWCTRRAIGVCFTDAGFILQRSWVKIKLRDLGFDVDCIKERRNDVRLDGTVPAVLSWEGGRIAGSTVNLSARGLRFVGRVSMAQLPVPSPLRVQIGPSRALPRLTCVGYCVNATAPHDGQWSASIRLLGMDAASDRLMQRYLGQLTRLAA